MKTIKKKLEAMQRKLFNHKRQILATLLVAILPLASTGAGLKAEEPLHTGVIRATFPGQFCGFDVTIELFGALAVFGPLDPAGFPSKDAGHRKITFTAANGKSIQLITAGLATNQFTLVNEEGTFTVIETFFGLPNKLSKPHGRNLMRNAGIIQFTLLIRQEEDGSFTVLENEITDVKGPHPNADSNFTLLCQIVADALM